MSGTSAQLPTTSDPPTGDPPAYTRRHSTSPTGSLDTYAAQHGITMRAVLAAALVRVTADWCPQPAFRLYTDQQAAVDVEVAPGRSFADLAKTVQSTLPAAAADEPVTMAVPGLLTHHADQSGDELRFTWDTADDLLLPEVATSMQAAHLALLRHLASGSQVWEQPLPDLLPPHQQAERQQANATTVPFAPVLLHELFWRQAAATPEATAVIDHGRQLTYRQLQHAATALAHTLTGHGAEPNQLIAVVMDKGWEQTAAVLGILAAGAAYVPIAPDLPADRLRHLLDHAQTRILVTQPHLASRLPRTPGIWRVVIDDTTIPIDATGTLGDEPPNRQRPTDLAYVIYTSGSTGLPKGVMIDHQAAVNTILDINRRFAVGPDDRVLAVSSLSFDLSVYDIFGLLAVGGAVVIPAPDATRAPWEWSDAITEHGVTIWNTVPALMEMLTTYSEGRGIPIPRSLRLVLMSGDWIPVPLPDRIRALAAPDIVLIGMGGATEASIWSNFYHIGEVDPAWPSIPYGTPLANQFFEVLDPDLRRRPTWVPGELHIGGAGVARGYWRDEARTAASFITHPQTGHRLYRTGDLGRYLPGGILEFLGRQDFQVKIHGFRVELGEIEATLLAHNGVTGAIVTAIDAGHGSKRLAAYVTPANAPVDTLREHLTAKLPSYMLPDRITAMATFPLTSNGKVDRTAL